MRRLIMWNLMTLNGFFEGSSPWDLRFHEAVWGKELEDLSIRQLRSADALVFGRRTYEGMAAYWQSAQGEIAERMNNLPKLVCSRTLGSANWNNTTVVQDGAEGVKALKHGGTGNLFVFGSADLSRTLIRNELYDELRIGLVPVVLGAGRPLFAGEAGGLTLSLQETTALSNGGVVLRYTSKRQ